MKSMQKKLQTLDLVLTSKEKDLKPFWNDVLKDKQSTLWFPTKIDLQESVLNSYSGSSLEQEALSPYWIKRKLNKNLIMITLSRSSLSSVTPIMENVTQVVTRKIRIYPKNEGKYVELCDLSRACYNKMTEFKINYKEDTRKFQEQRTEVMNLTKTWNNYQSHVMQEACRSADITNKAIIKKRKQGKKCEASFKSFKDSVQGFDIQRLSKSTIYPRFAGDVFITEDLPSYAIGKTARVIVEDGCWYLCCLDTKEIPVTKKLEKFCALDCGVRTFQVVYSPNEVATLGEDFFKEKLLPLFLRLDQLLSLKKKQENKKSEHQASKDLLRNYQKRIYKLRSRIKNLTRDLHDKSANYLTNEFDLIMIPKFEVKNMTKVDNRKLNNKSVRAMIGLSHYAFKERLKWFAKKKGKVVVEVCEAFTSKTNPFTGELMNIGSKRVFKHEDISYERDMNGARNIFIKNTLLK